MKREGDPAHNVLVVGVDLEATGVCALREAMRLSSRQADTSLHVVYVIEVPDGLHDAERIAQLSDRVEQARRELRAHVEDIIRTEARLPPHRMDFMLHVRIGKPAAAILQAAIDADADMIVVGTHGRTGMRRWLEGSVAEDLIHMGRCPVVVAHPKDFAGLSKSAQVDPPRTDGGAGGYSEQMSFHLPQRTSHIAGLI